MKTNLSLMTLAAVICCTLNMTVLTSCTDDEANPMPSPEPKDLAEYTILYYANGGANVDNCIIPMLADFYEANPEAYKKVNVVVQYKFSTTENMLEQADEMEEFTPQLCEMFGSKTVRWAIDPTKTLRAQLYSRNNIYGKDNADCTCPDSLTNFINWATKAYPAKKYMLVVNDHGGGYVPHDELPEQAASRTRGLLYDDGYPVPDEQDKHFTAKSFHRAVAAANVRFETIYLLACLMNNLEYQFELQDLCDYIIASTYTMPAWGGALDVLPGILSQTDVDIERALDAYCQSDVASWDDFYSNDEEYSEDDPFYTDLTVTKTANIAHLGMVMREFVDRLCDTYQNGTEAQRQAIDDCTSAAVKVELNSPYYDVAKYMSSIMKTLPEVYDDDFYNQMREAFNSCILAQYFSKYLTTHQYMVDYSVLLGAEGAYSVVLWEDDEELDKDMPNYEMSYCADGTKEGYNIILSDDYEYLESIFDEQLSPWGSTLADTYEQLAFDRAVGWSRWLYLNRQAPSLFCPKDLHYKLPMPED